MFSSIKFSKSDIGRSNFVFPTVDHICQRELKAAEPWFS